MRIHWGRIVVAAIFSEVLVVVVLLTITTMHRFLIAPGRTAAEYQAFSDLAAYYVAPASAGVAAVLGALWVCAKLTSGFVVNGTLVGVVAVILFGGLIFIASVSFILRIAGGYFGGVLAQRRPAQEAT